MEKILHVLEHSLIDTAKLVPFLVLVYFLIEFLEYKNIFRFEKSKLLNGKASPIIGALFGSVPQCGFSVISSELFAKRKISVAALIAVFIATSDEAIPLMLADYKSIPALLILIATKIVLAIIIGYSTMALHKVFFKQSEKELLEKIKSLDSHSDTIILKDTEETTETDSFNTNHSDKESEHLEESEEHSHDHDEETSHHEDEHDHDEEIEHIHACCHHDLKDHKFDWKHPLIHSLKITLYIFIINFILGALIEFLGEDKLVDFLSSSKPLQPILALAIGLIPNCASSVVLTELYLMNGLSFGAIVTGLSVNAGLGLLVLFKENKNKRENLFIVLMLIISSLIFGYLLHFLPLNFLNF